MNTSATAGDPLSATSGPLAASIPAYCSRIGTDPLLVQGAGGNISWKERDALWIKASGMWLGEAQRKPIFVAVDLPHLRQALAQADYSVVPRTTASAGSSPLRPSIETLLHALVPHRVVIHLHAVEILACLVRHAARQEIAEKVGDAFRWIFVDYFKPGADLARAIDTELRRNPGTEVVFLKNHGVVIGADDVDRADQILRSLCSLLKSLERTAHAGDAGMEGIAANAAQAGYRPTSDAYLHQLAADPALLGRLESAWALYPDHVVFLGARANVCDSPDQLGALALDKNTAPPFVFLRGAGVLEHSATTEAQRVQLRCYRDVLARQAEAEALDTLSRTEIGELLNWDAEKYRQSLPPSA